MEDKYFFVKLIASIEDQIKRESFLSEEEKQFLKKIRELKAKPVLDYLNSLFQK